MCRGAASDPVLYGGRSRGYDVLDGERLIDATVLVPMGKSERAEAPDCVWKLHRKHHEPFDPERTTHLALVKLPETQEMNFDLRFDGDAFTLTGSTRGTAISIATVEEVNARLLPDEALENNWHYLYIEEKWLIEHRVR